MIWCMYPNHRLWVREDITLCHYRWKSDRLSHSLGSAELFPEDPSLHLELLLCLQSYIWCQPSRRWDCPSCLRSVSLLGQPMPYCRFTIPKKHSTIHSLFLLYFLLSVTFLFYFHVIYLLFLFPCLQESWMHWSSCRLQLLVVCICLRR